MLDEIRDTAHRVRRESRLSRVLPLLALPTRLLARILRR